MVFWHCVIAVLLHGLYILVLYINSYKYIECDFDGYSTKSYKFNAFFFKKSSPIIWGNVIWAILLIVLEVFLYNHRGEKYEEKIPLFLFLCMTPFTTAYSFLNLSHLFPTPDYLNRSLTDTIGFFKVRNYSILVFLAFFVLVPSVLLVRYLISDEENSDHLSLLLFQLFWQFALVICFLLSDWSVENNINKWGCLCEEIKERIEKLNSELVQKGEELEKAKKDLEDINEKIGLDSQTEQYTQVITNLPKLKEQIKALKVRRKHIVRELKYIHKHYIAQ